MDATHSLSAQVLDEDLQIVRATLATISGDVRQLSGIAGQAVEEALVKLDEAQRAFFDRCGGRDETAPALASVRAATRLSRRKSREAEAAVSVR